MWCLAVLPTSSISPVLIHFWQLVNLLFFGTTVPSKYFLSGVTPALIHNTVGSFIGIRGADSTSVCPLSQKKSKYILIILFPVNFFIILSPYIFYKYLFLILLMCR